MGDTISTVTIDWDLVESYYTTAVESNFLPDVGIDQTFQKFSFANSDRILQQHFSDNLAEADVLQKVPEYFQSVGQALAPLTKAPNSVGLGAVVISIILDLLIGLRPATDRTDNDIPAMLQRVFNNEKSNAILVTMDNYVKQHRIHIHDTPELIRIAQNTKDTLSVQLTALRHTMDTEMSTHHLKHWVNGAAFHVLLLAHIANMKHSECGDCSAVHQSAAGIAVDIYLNKLPGLLDKYRQYKDMYIYPVFSGERVTGCRMADPQMKHRPNTIHHYMYVGRCPLRVANLNQIQEISRRHSEEYIKRMCTGLLERLRTYFTDLKSSLPSLITHHGVFRVPTCREVQRTYRLNCY